MKGVATAILKRTLNWINNERVDGDSRSTAEKLITGEIKNLFRLSFKTSRTSLGH